jgi:hypothetical protein
MFGPLTSWDPWIVRASSVKPYELRTYDKDAVNCTQLATAAEVFANSHCEEDGVGGMVLVRFCSSYAAAS